MALIVECKTLKHFQEIFILLLIVADTEFEDSIIAIDNKCLTPFDVRQQLENVISDRNSIATILIPEINETDLEEKKLLDEFCKDLILKT